MQDLRLVGVHEDGQHLLLVGDGGARFRLPLDEALRAAARRDRPRLGQLQIELDGGLRPREVQALIRSGLSTEEVADRAGWSVDKVRRYEGPVLAEREHVAGLARAVRVRAHGRGTDESLAARVNHRLTGRGVDPTTAVWDTARDGDGHWSVLVLFSAGGRERTATWLFDVPDRTVAALDDEARWLSEDDADQSGPIPVPHLPTPTSAPTTVYDVESDGGVAGPRAHRRPQDPVDLMAAMRESSRSRRPRRRTHQPTLTPVDEAPRDDALPLESVQHDPEGEQLPPSARGAHPLDDAPVELTEAATAAATTAADADATAVEPDSPPADASEDDHVADGAGATEDDHATDAAGAPSTAVETSPPAAHPVRPRRGGRPSVPRWDDIMFGAKGTSADPAKD